MTFNTMVNARQNGHLEIRMGFCMMSVEEPKAFAPNNKSRNQPLQFDRPTFINSRFGNRTSSSMDEVGAPKGHPPFPNLRSRMFWDWKRLNSSAESNPTPQPLSIIIIARAYIGKCYGHKLPQCLKSSIL